MFKPERWALLERPFIVEIILRMIDKLNRYIGIGSGGQIEHSGEVYLARRIRGLYEDQRVTVFDIGANRGQFLVMLAAEFQVSAVLVHCFEPGAVQFAQLQNKRTELEHDITLVNCALGECDGRAILHFDQPGSGLASLTKRNLAHYDIDFDDSEEVSVTTLDKYCASTGVERIHWLKLDVEGHELDVLKGAIGLLSNAKVDLVTFEFGGCNIDTRTFLRDFWEFFHKFDMSLFRLAPNGALIPVVRYSEAVEQFQTSNFVVTAPHTTISN